jgi:hypothetical protein
VRWTRRGFLGTAAAAALAGPLAASARASSWAAPAPGPAGRFLTRPDLNPPPVSVAVAGTGRSPGLIFLAPFDITDTSPNPRFGPLIVDDAGNPVWFRPVPKHTGMDFRVQHYQGRPVLTWYEGDVLGGYGGDFVIADASYREIGRVKAQNGMHGDLHEFLITSRGTGLISIYALVSTDLTAVGGPASGGQAVEGVIQEIDIASGKVIFEWHSLDHVPLTESTFPMKSPSGTIDYFHLNSIGVDADGGLLVSARHTSGIYKVNRKSGEVEWRLGGTKSDFALPAEAQFSFQHDVRRHSDGTITIFDNNASNPKSPPATRVLRLALDVGAKTASVHKSYALPQPRLCWAMGNAQQLPDYGLFVGWGTAGSFTELAPDGTVRFDAAFTDGSVTYRAFRYPWVGRPTTRPNLSVTRVGQVLTLHASWNGATEVARWQVQAGAARGALKPVRTVPRSGFETAVSVPHHRGYVAAAALDSTGRVLGSSAPVRV